jgi:nucleoside-diphosphate-sugar epimerase
MVDGTIWKMCAILIKCEEAISMTNVDESFEKCLVTGGAGMLGYEIVCQLLKEGKFVRVLDLQPLHDDCIDSIVGDIRNQDDVTKACNGVDIVFQTAATIWEAGIPVSLYDETNVEGNRIVIGTCKRLGVPKLVYTGTMDVVFDGRKPIVSGDESLPYPKKVPENAYCRTKMIAEQMVIRANGPNLMTCSLRPVGMYGPRDKYHIPNIVKAAKSRYNMRLGDGSARFSHVYSENAAYAHILAAKHLKPGSPVAGQCYFITDHEPSNFFDFMQPFLEGLGLPVPKRSVPYWLAYVLGWFAEIFAPGSNLNRFSVVQTCVDNTFVHDKATRDFGYEPIVSREEAIERTLRWFRRQEELVSH